MTDLAEARPLPLSYFQLFRRFLGFGMLAFGGPVAQIAMIREKLVEQERWLTPAQFNRLLAVMQILPGPEAHELCVHLGIRARGRIGGLLAGLGFMLPGFVLMLAVAWIYVRFASSLPVLNGAFLGIQLVVVAIIARAVHRIGMHMLEDRWLWVIAGVTSIATLLGVAFWIILLAAGFFYVTVQSGRYVAASFVALGAGLAVAAQFLLPVSINIRIDEASTANGWVLLLTGLKAGLLTFGGAYTAIPYIRADTVPRGWISDGQFLDGVAFAGVLPAPLIIFGTFVGFVAGGWVGALAVTAGIFLPAFAFSMLFYERLEQAAEHVGLRRLLAGVGAGVVGVIAATCLELASATFQRASSIWWASLIFLPAMLIAWRWKSRFASLVLVLIGSLAGFLIL